MNMSDLENMIIWERDIYITLLNNKIEKENQEIQNSTSFQEIPCIKPIRTI